ncbi:MAG: hypothetical protein R3C99_19600 [Pirellulaceae bacterium]
MSRIFSALAAVALALLVTNIVIGLSFGDYNGMTLRWLALTRDVREADLRERQSRGEVDAVNLTNESLAEARSELAELDPAFKWASSWKNFHFMFGVFAGLVTLLVNAVAVTYFIGTSRWCREVVDAYGIDDSPADESVRLKRRTFPWAVTGMLTMVAIAALGAASDPTGSVPNSQNWVMVHRIVAIVGTAIIGWAFWNQAHNVKTNHGLIELILADVRRVRRDRGMEDLANDHPSALSDVAANAAERTVS